MSTLDGSKVRARCVDLFGYRLIPCFTVVVHMKFRSVFSVLLLLVAIAVSSCLVASSTHFVYATSGIHWIWGVNKELAPLFSTWVECPNLERSTILQINQVRMILYSATNTTIFL